VSLQIFKLQKMSFLKYLERKGLSIFFSMFLFTFLD